jgi:iron complex outermembrane recepter protein
MLRGRLLSAVFCLTVPCAVGQAIAQTSDSGIETVVVTAERRGEDVQAIPITIQAITGKQIMDLGIKSSSDLSQFAPNVAIALPAGAGNQPIITIRGVGLNDYDTNNAGPNGVYMDEVYLASPASQTFQAFDLERIEVLKGPQGTLYGRNTSGGAINFISAKPTDDFTGSFHAEGGSYDDYQLQGAVGGQITDGLDGRIAIVKNGSGGYTFNSLTGTRENGVNNIAGRAQLLWKPISDLSILLNVHGGLVANRPAEYRHLGSFDPVTFDECSPQRVNSSSSDCVDLFGYGTPKNFYAGAYNRREHLLVRSGGVSLRADYTLGSLTFTSLSSFERNDKIHPEDTDAGPNRLLEINFGVHSTDVTQELRVSTSGDNYNWLMGAYYLGEDLHQDQPIFELLDVDNFFGPHAGDASGDPANPNPITATTLFDNSRQITNSYAVFTQGDYSITDALKLTLGARFTGESKSFRYSAAQQVQINGINNYGPITPIISNFFNKLANESFNWKAALDYKFTDKIMAYGSVSTGFKSGGFNGSFLSTDPALIEAQLQPIKPENVTTFEVGSKATFFDDRLLFDASVFYNQYRDLQIFILTPVIGTLTETNILANARHAHMMGADLSMIAKPLDDLTFSAQLGLLQAKVDSSEVLSVDAGGNPVTAHGHQLPLAPHVTFTTAVDYRVPLDYGALDFQLNASYKSHQFFDIANSPYLTQRPYWLENARVAYSFDEDQWEVAGFVRNLSGQKYYLDIFDLSSLGFFQGIMGQPRTFGGELNYRF